MNFYLPGPYLRDLRQGDIVGPLPFVAVDISSQVDVLLPNTQDTQSVDLALPQPEGTAAILPVTWSLGLILTQCCDLGVGDPTRTRPVLLARVSSWESIHGNGGTLKTIVERVKTYANSGKSPSKFYLPPNNANPNFQRSVADLLVMVSMPSQAKDKLVDLRIARLTDPARQALQERVAYCFGRALAYRTTFILQISRNWTTHTHHPMQIDNSKRPGVMSSTRTETKVGRGRFRVCCAYGHRW